MLDQEFQCICHDQRGQYLERGHHDACGDQGFERKRHPNCQNINANVEILDKTLTGVTRFWTTLNVVAAGGRLASWTKVSAIHSYVEKSYFLFSPRFFKNIQWDGCPKVKKVSTIMFQEWLPRRVVKHGHCIIFYLPFKGRPFSHLILWIFQKSIRGFIRRWSQR